MKIVGTLNNFPGALRKFLYSLFFLSSLWFYSIFSVTVSDPTGEAPTAGNEEPEEEEQQEQWEGKRFSPCMGVPP